MRLIVLGHILLGYVIARLHLNECFIPFVRIASLAFLLLEVELILTGSIISVSSNIVIAIKALYRCRSPQIPMDLLTILGSLSV